MTWEGLACLLAGVAIGEYYRRVHDKIRREQIEDLREERPVEPPPRCSARREPTLEELEWVEVFDELERPRRRRTPVITEEQFSEMKETGRTAGKIKGGEKV